MAGIFRGVKVEELPARLEPFFIAMEVEADPHEFGEHVFDLRMIDEDGNVVYENQIEANFEQRPDFLPSYMYFCGQIFVANPVEKEGIYRFDLVWNNETLAQARLEVAA